MTNPSGLPNGAGSDEGVEMSCAHWPLAKLIGTADEMSCSRRPIGESYGVAYTPSLDIDLLRSFVLIAEGESFTRAAARIGRTQSTVSLQVQRLESMVGHRLFVRAKGGGVQLTPQGRYLLDRARDIVSLNDRVVGELRSLPEGTGIGGRNSELEAPNVSVGGLKSRPSIAVLPFQNMSGDLEREYFVDGLAEGIIAGLSRIKWLVVIAWNSALTYKCKSVDVRQVGRELGVRYVLQGGVHCSASRIRIALQLLDTETRKHLWAEKYEGPQEDIFELEDRISDQVAGIVEPSLQRSEIERSRRQRPENLDAYDLYLRALPHVAAQMPHEVSAALPLLKQALRLDPDYSAAHALLAWCHELRFARGGFDKAERLAAVRHASAVIASDTDDAATLAVAGFALALMSGDHEVGLNAIGRALALNPACATALYLGAQAHALLDPGVTTAAFLADRALRLSPLDTFAFQAHLALGETALKEARYEDAASCFARAAQTKPNFGTLYYFKGMAMALAGQTDAAGRTVKRGMELEPNFQVRIVFEHGMPRILADRFIEGARLLGLRQ